MRTDMGTENTYIEQMQLLFKRDILNESIPPYFFGSSNRNQKMECWWSILRKHFTQFWMNLFKKIKDDDCFHGSYVEKAVIMFCFFHIIQVSPELVNALLYRVIQKLCMS